MKKLSRTDALILRNQLAIMRRLMARDDYVKHMADMRLAQGAGYTSQFLQDNDDGN